MKTDVRPILAALKAERASLDAVIRSLERLTASEATVTAKPTRATRVKKTRSRINRDTKAAIVARMRRTNGATLSDVARVCAQEYGIPWSTIQSRWYQWAKAVPMPIVEAHV